MPLNYNFINDVSQAVRSELSRRQDYYWPNGEFSDTALSWNYQKTAYLVLTSLRKDTYERFTIQGQGLGVLKRPTTPTVPGDGQPWPPAAFAASEPATETITTYTEQSRMVNPSAPILDLYGKNYTTSDGTIKGAVLNSAEITSDGTYGSILRITVNFTVFNINELDRYIKNFLTPGQDIGLEYGWTVRENVNVNRGKIRGTVYNFTFSAKEDGSWDCTLNAIGPSSMTYGFDLDQNGSDDKDASILTAKKGLHLEEILKTLIDVTDNDKETEAVTISTGGKCKKRSVYKAYQSFAANPNIPSTLPDIRYDKVNTYIFELPVDRDYTFGTKALAYIVKGAVAAGARQSGEANAAYQDTLNRGSTKTNNSKTTYITLRNLINLINLQLDAAFKSNIPHYTFNGFDERGNILTEDVCKIDAKIAFLGIGPVDFSKFAFTTQINGNTSPRFDFNVSEVEGTTRNGGIQKIADLVLLNVNFLYSEVTSILSNNKNLTDKKIITFLNNIFQQLETDTGGTIRLVIQDSPINKTSGKSEYIQILNQNYEGNDIRLNPCLIPAFTKGSIVRGLDVISSVPDAIQTEVATYTRAGASYVGNDASADELSSNLQELNSQLIKLNGSFMENIVTDDSVTQTSLSNWQSQIRAIYRQMFNIQQGGVLGGKGSSISQYSLANLKTAIFPIKLKVTMDGIEGFQYGNAITTNWIPKQYRKAKVYWTVIKIRHMIQNNDWVTELETIYRVIS
jgi:hypothetical protein